MYEEKFMDLSSNDTPKAQDRNIRDNYLDLWSDLFSYASNLKGNWLTSQEIFDRYLVPTAEENPLLFAKWVTRMVKNSGKKIKYKYLFIKSLRFLKRFKTLKKATKQDLSRALVGLFKAGLDEPLYAQNALNNKLK